MNIQKFAPHYPNYSPCDSQVSTPKTYSLFRTILERYSTSSYSPSLQTKRVTHQVQNISPINTFISPSLNVMSSQQQFSQINASLTQIKLKIKEIEEEAYLKKNNEYQLNEQILHRANYAAKLLAMAKIYQAWGKECEAQHCIESAYFQVTETARLNYFHCDTHFAAYLFETYNGMTCLDLHIIRDNLLTLRRAIALYPTSAKLNAELEQATAFFKARWQTLTDEGTLEKGLYELLTKELEQILNEDPFKEEFIKTPNLLKKVKNAPTLLHNYPHLKSEEDFLVKYPEAGVINLPDNIYHAGHLNACIHQAKTSPLARLLVLIFPESLLTPDDAKHVKDLLVEKQSVTIALGNGNDLITLIGAFKRDTNLIFGENSLLSSIKYLDSYSQIFYFSINLQYLIKQKVKKISLSQNSLNLSSELYF